MTNSNSNSDLDALDLKILTHYQADTRCPAQTIGAIVGLSAAAVQRRLKRMRESGVIVCETAQLAPDRLGFPITCIVGVRLERESRGEHVRFKQAMASHPWVQQCYYVTGDVDFMLVVLTRDVREFERFAQQALHGDPNVKSFTTFVCLERVKVTSAIPL